MNIIISLLTIFQLSFTPSGEAINPEDVKNVEQAVIKWADETFLKHENYKFEDYRVFYTDAYFMQTMRVEMYSEKLTELKRKKAEKQISLSEDEYNMELSKLENLILKAEKDLKENPAEKIDYQTINFWSNVQTSDGITVYYEFKMTLNSDLEITKAIENSSIGKKNPQTAILYKTSATRKVTSR